MNMTNSNTYLQATTLQVVIDLASGFSDIIDPG